VRRDAAAVWAALGLAAALAWWLTLRPMTLMPGMAGMGTPLLPFLAMWAAMMAAMMLPAVTPVALLWTRAIRVQSPGWRGAGRLAQFVGGYLGAWTAAGLAAYALVLVMENVLTSALAHRALLAGALALAGIWQLTPLKAVCLRHCRSPIGFIVQHVGTTGPLRDLRVGAHHGAWCLGCCWALMVVLVVAGMMSVALMVGLTALVVAEKTLSFGPALARCTGWGLLLGAGAALATGWTPAF
jgi:predicted metal-binding membrane protein